MFVLDSPCEATVQSQFQSGKKKGPAAEHKQNLSLQTQLSDAAISKPKRKRKKPPSKGEKGYTEYREANTIDSRNCRANRKTVTNQIHSKLLEIEQQTATS